MKKSSVKVILAGMVGNALEFYDFTLFGALSVVLSQKFFPSHDGFSSLLSMLATFAVGFFARPLGAVLLGHIGDRMGRKTALTLSMLMMAIPTFIIGILPTYETIGFLAPFLLVICRLFQGICAGGEYNGSAIFLIEHNKDKPNFAGSLASVAGTTGCLLGVIVGALSIHPTMPEWMWRLPFIMGLFLGGAGLYLRFKIEESPAFQKAQQSQQIVKVPFVEVLKHHKMSVLCCLMGAALSGTLGTTFIIYIPIYLSKVMGLVLHKSMYYNSFGMTVYILSAPIAGYLADHYDQRKIMMSSAFMILLLIFPIFLLLQGGTTPHILLSQTLLCVFSAGFIAPMNAFMNALFPTPLRYSGVTLGYGLGMALFGGLMPLVSTFVIEKYNFTLFPALYIAIFTLVGVSILFIGKRIKAENTKEALTRGEPVSKPPLKAAA